jgi:hypothetical protein
VDPGYIIVAAYVQTANSLARLVIDVDQIAGQQSGDDRGIGSWQSSKIKLAIWRARYDRATVSSSVRDNRNRERHEQRGGDGDLFHGARSACNA